LISSSYYIDEGERKKFEKGGQKLYSTNEYEAVRAPDKPDWIEFCEDEEEMSDSQKQKEFEKLTAKYNEELDAYNKKVEAGKYIKALVVIGNSGIGQIVHVKLNPKKSTGSSKATAEKVKEGKLTAGDITEEIKRIQDREKRNKELDINKIHAQIEAEAKKSKSKILALENKPIDRAIMIWILLTEIGYNPDWRNETMGYAFEKFKELSKWSDKQVSQRIRKIVFDRMVHAGSDVEVRHKHTAIRLIAEYAGIDIKAIELEQKEIANARIEKVNKRIADLQKKKKELQPVKTEKKKVKK
jgi:hypothetical protein